MSDGAATSPMNRSEWPSATLPTERNEMALIERSDITYTAKRNRP